MPILSLKSEPNAFKNDSHGTLAGFSLFLWFLWWLFTFVAASPAFSQLMNSNPTAEIPTNPVLPTFGDKVPWEDIFKENPQDFDFQKYFPPGTDLTQLEAYLGVWGNTFDQFDGGQVIGNGGDPLYLIAQRARLGAFLALSELDLGQFSDSSLSESEKKVLNFLAHYKSIFLKFIKYADFIWIQKAYLPPGAKIQATCALTNVSHPSIPPTTIFFILETCKESVALTQIYPYFLQLILHEITHQFSRAEICARDCASESFADSVAIFIYSNWKLQKIRQGNLWQLIPKVPLSGRKDMGTAFSGDSNSEEALNNKIFIWGGCSSEGTGLDYCAKAYNDGVIIKVEEKKRLFTSTYISDTNAPSPRKNPVIFWSGIEGPKAIKEKFLIYGGCQPSGWGCAKDYHDIYSFDVQTTEFQLIASDTPLLLGRIETQHIWTGKELFIFGGTNLNDDEYYADGAFYSWDQNGKGSWKKWSPPAELNFRGRKHHTLVHTGAEILIWGGCSQLLIGCKVTGDGLRYELKTGVWHKISSVGAPEARMLHSAVWNGRHMIIWGGASNNGVLASGAYYDPEADIWSSLPTSLPAFEQGRVKHLALWSDPLQSLLIWGGISTGDIYPSEPLALTLDAEGNYSWRTLSSAVNLLGRSDFSQTFLGHGFFVWGGQRNDHDMDDGGYFEPAELLE